MDNKLKIQVIILIFIVSLTVIQINISNNIDKLQDEVYISNFEWVDDFCYNIHNVTSISKYSESWGSAYRLCLLNNIGTNENKTTVPYFNEIDGFCYSIDYPNSGFDYCESWRTSYRNCLLNNIGAVIQ